MFKVAFNEDKEVLETIQIEAENAPQRHPMRIAINKGPMEYRKRIKQLVDAEHNLTTSSTFMLQFKTTIASL